MPGKAQTTGAALEFDVDGSGGGGGGDATAANQLLEIAELIAIEADVSDVSTETTLALIKAKTDNLDVALSTRTSPADQQHVIVDSGSVSTGGLTDTQLRATAVPVSATDLDIRNLVFATDKVDVSGSTGVGVTGPLTDTQLRATAVPVSGPLTDTQLRASAVPVSATSLPLPTDAATQTTLALIKSKTDNLDVALSTRTKPADAQHAIVDSGTITAVTAITNALPAGTNNIGFVTPTPSATGGWSVFNATSGDGSTALTNSAQSIKSSQGTLGGWYIYNPNSVVCYVLIYNVSSGSVTVGTTNPAMILAIPPGSAANLELINGIQFGTAITAAAVMTTAGGNTAPTTALEANFWYK